MRWCHCSSPRRNISPTRPCVSPCVRLASLEILCLSIWTELHRDKLFTRLVNRQRDVFAACAIRTINAVASKIETLHHILNKSVVDRVWFRVDLGSLLKYGAVFEQTNTNNGLTLKNRSNKKTQYTSLQVWAKISSASPAVCSSGSRQQRGQHQLPFFFVWTPLALFLSHDAPQAEVTCRNEVVRCVSRTRRIAGKPKYHNETANGNYITTVSGSRDQFALIEDVVFGRRRRWNVCSYQ